MNCKYCKADCAMRGDDNPKECRGFIPMTNADHIRSVTDEELVAVLSNPGICASRDMMQCDAMKDCGTCVLDWLKQPYEVDT